MLAIVGVIDASAFTNHLESASAVTNAVTGEVVNLTLTEPNTLRETLVDKEYTSISSFTLHGPVGSDDLKCIHEGSWFTDVEVVDLTDITIVPDDGLYAHTDVKSHQIIRRQNHYLSARDEIKVTNGTNGLGIGYTITDIYTTDLGGLFARKESLRVLKMPNSVKSVGYGLCYGCSNLTTVSFPKSVTKVKYGAFCSCTQLRNHNFGQLTEIEGYAFEDNYSLEGTLDLSKCMSIGDGAFYRSGLTEVNLSNASVVPREAFKYCNSLKKVTFSDKLTSVGRYAFSGCSALATIEGLPKTLEDVGATSFENTPWFNKIAYDNGVKYINDVAMCASSTVSNLNFREGTTRIADDFVCDNHENVTSLTLPSSLRYIGHDALNGLGITTLTIPEGIEYIGGLAGSNATKINYNAISSKIEVEEGICGACQKVVIGKKVQRIPACFAEYGGELTIVDFEGRDASAPKVTIGERAFYKCKNLKRFNGFQYVDSIGKYAFAYTGFSSITLGTNLREIGYSAFYVSTLKHIKCDKRTDADVSLTIGENAFANCSGLVDFDAWEYVDSIKSHAFSRCTSLKSIGTSNRLKFVGYSPFDYCNIDSIYFNGIGDESALSIEKDLNITSVIIGKDATKVPDNAFSYKSSLKSVSFEERENGSLVEILEKAFYHCYSLKNIDFQYVKSIGEDAFAGCAFDSLYLSKNIASISPGAFAGNSTLQYVYYDIPDIDGYNIFWSYDENTAALQTVVVGPSVRVLGSVFGGCDNLSCITFDGWKTPQGTNYGAKAKRLVATATSASENQTLKIKDYALSDLKGLDGTDLILPHGTQEIGYNAFNNVTFKRVFVPSTNKKCDNNGDWQQKVSYNYREDTDVILLADIMYVLPSLLESYRARYTSSYTFLPMSEEYLPTGMKAVLSDMQNEIDMQNATFYNMEGQHVINPKGLTIVRNADGSTRKVMMK